MRSLRSLSLPLVFLLGVAEAQVDQPETYEAVVLHARSGDTLLVRREGRKRGIEVRLIGLDAPERAGRDRAGQEPWGAESQQWLAERLVQRKVRLQLDLERVASGRTQWVYVWLEDELINESILRKGMAFLHTVKPNVRYVDRLRVAQEKARAEGKGVWKFDKKLEEIPSDFLARLQKAQAEERAKLKALTIDQWREGCVVGNRNSKVYHLPEGAYYLRARQSRHAVFFPTEENAVEAGFRVSSR